MRPPCSRHQIPKDVRAVDEDWQNLNHRLTSHLSIIRSHTNSLEEDQSLEGTPSPLDAGISETPPPLDAGILKTLEAYVELVQLLGLQSPTDNPL